MTHIELNALPHGTMTELDAIPSITLRMTKGASFLVGSKTRVFDPVETDEGWTGCARMPRTSDFFPRRSYTKDTYELVK